MPELPEVETIKEALRKAVEGAVIQKVIVRNRKFRIPVPADFEDTLEGAAILKIYRIAKFGQRIQRGLAFRNERKSQNYRYISCRFGKTRPYYYRYDKGNLDV